MQGEGKLNGEGSRGQFAAMTSMVETLQLDTSTVPLLNVWRSAIGSALSFTSFLENIVHVRKGLSKSFVKQL